MDVILYIYILVTDSSRADLGGGHQGNGKVDLPKVNITWYLTLAGNCETCFPHQVPLHHRPIKQTSLFIIL